MGAPSQLLLVLAPELLPHTPGKDPVRQREAEVEHPKLTMVTLKGKLEEGLMMQLGHEKGRPPGR